MEWIFVLIAEFNWLQPSDKGFRSMPGGLMEMFSLIQFWVSIRVGGLWCLASGTYIQLQMHLVTRRFG
jgi:hypothetical protein